MNSVGPLLGGRIPNSLQLDRLRGNLSEATLQLTRLQDQISSGQRFFLPSENPNASIRSIILQSELERTSQYQTNVNTSSEMLSATEQSLSHVGEVLNQVKSMILAGIGESTTQGEKKALATEASALLQDVVRTANTKVRGRYLFAGGQTDSQPFAYSNLGTVKYTGNTQSIGSLIDSVTAMASNIDGASAFAAVSEAITSDLNPAVTSQTRIDDLHEGRGVVLGEIIVTLDDGGTPQREVIDLSQAKTLGDVETLLENAFAAGPLTLDVSLSTDGLVLTPSSGTVQVENSTGSLTAADLGIASGAAAAINGGDLNPELTLHSTIASLNGGAGITATSGTGLLITNGAKSEVVDISSATTIEELFNTLLAADLDLDVAIHESGNGISITTRLSGADFSIGENGGSEATDLGIRTMTEETLLSSLNHGVGVDVDSGTSLEITRRDGSNVSIDLAGSKTVGDVIAAINAAGYTGLTASLNTVGNGIQLIDDDGSSTGPLIVAANSVGDGLGMSGTEASGVAANALQGDDVNPQQAWGIFSILSSLPTALSNADDAELARLGTMIDDEISRFSLVRGEVASRLKLLDEANNRLADEDLRFQERLSEEFDADLTETILHFTELQTVMQATLQLAAQSLNMSLLSYL